MEDFNFPWPGSAYIIDQLEIALVGSAFTTPSAEVTFIAARANKKYGPYSVEYESTYFREVEVEIDREDHAVDPEPYYTHTHPDHPADLPKENLTLENTFAKSGIRIIRSAEFIPLQ